MKRLITLVAALALALPGLAQEKVLNLYSSRHYQTDEALYANFTKKTGIKVNRIEANEDALLERLKNEGARSPADVLVTVDAGRLWRAEQMGLFQPVKSAVLEERIPGELRHPDGLWFAFSVRARPVFYLKGSVDPKQIRDYEDLADPEVEGQDLHPLELQHVQPLAHELDDRGHRAGEGRGVGQGRRGQLRAQPQGRRHRPAQGRGRRRVPDRGGQHLLLRAPHEVGQAGRARGRREGRRDLPQPVRARHARERLRRRRHEARARTATRR